ncbi:50S ribosomal protein L15 [Patescibacteria group bacterium]|nr:50S ribosomal protein L15 [Patescibacteria group bacterium]
MNLQSLKKQVKNKKRKGRGISAGSGKTAGRGTKGQKSRSGGKLRPGFEGGQNPLTKRVPKKRGFKSISPKAETVTLTMLDSLKEGSVITAEFLKKEGIVKSDRVKIVSKGKITKKLTINVPISKGAAEKIIKSGGKV